MAPTTSFWTNPSVLEFAGEPLAAIRDWAEAHIHEIIAARERRDRGHDQ